MAKGQDSDDGNFKSLERQNSHMRDKKKSGNLPNPEGLKRSVASENIQKIDELFGKLSSHHHAHIFNHNLSGSDKDAAGNNILLLANIILDMKLEKYTDSTQIGQDIRKMIQQQLTISQ